MIRKALSLLLPTLATLSPLSAEVIVVPEVLTLGNGFSFEKQAAPATNDLGTTAKWSVLSGKQDRNSAPVSAFHDGKLPKGDDEPRANFFFAAGTDGGRILVDLGKEEKIDRISSYSRHFNSRGPQVYTLYGSVSDQAPKADDDLLKAGWVEITKVDTRNPKEKPGGRHGVSIMGKDGPLGSYRQLIFDVRPTEKKTQFGLTFFSEIDIVKTDGPKLTSVSVKNPSKIIRFATEDKKFNFIIDATEAPQYADWTEKELKPVILEWYPKLVALLPGKDYTAPTTVTFEYRNDVRPGIPAYALGSKVTLNAPWFKNQLKREAKGCVVHELVHVVQNYWIARRVNRRAQRTPSWITEGVADYIRWFLYEPESKGAIYSPERLKKMKHDASYRITGNFMDWVSRNHNKDIVKLINDEARNGRYSDALWKEYTGKPLNELAEDWKSQ